MLEKRRVVDLTSVKCSWLSDVGSVPLSGRLFWPQRRSAKRCGSPGFAGSRQQTSGPIYSTSTAAFRG